MKRNKMIVTSLFSALLAAATVTPSFAAGAENLFSADHVTVASGKSFEQVSDAVKVLVAKNGMMVMAEVNQGKMLSMTGLTLNATLFLVGNPTVGKQLFEQNHSVGLYVPLRVFVYTGQNGNRVEVGSRLRPGADAQSGRVDYEISVPPDATVHRPLFEAVPCRYDILATAQSVPRGLRPPAAS